MSNPPFNDSDTALRDGAFLQSEATRQVVSEAKDNMAAIARRMAELLEKAQSAKSTRPSSP
jgi:hypothetical protein